MLRPRAFATLALLGGVVLAGCGSDGPGERSAASGTTPVAAGQLPALARAARTPGEVLFAGEASPAMHGPFELDGRYLVRFEQFAPEDPAKDFAGETPFTASLRPVGASDPGLKLFGAARPRGQRTLTRHGRYVLDVSFGDFPYAVRFTPRR
jgi:hypothetical protein